MPCNSNETARHLDSQPSDAALKLNPKIAGGDLESIGVGV